MPTDVLSDESTDTVRLHRGLRLALAPAAVFAAGLLLDWPLFYVGAVLAAIFTQAPAPIPTRSGLSLVAKGTVFMALAWLLATALDPYPLVFLIAICIAVALCFRASVAGSNILIIVFALLGALLIPFLVRLSPELAHKIMVWLPGNLLIALLAAWSAFFLFPAVAPAQAVQTDLAADFDADRRLIRICLVTLTFVVIFFVTEGNAALTLMFIAIQSSMLAASTGSVPVVARATLLANAAGGVVAVLIYEVLVMAPLLPVAVLSVLAACLFFAERFTKGDKLAATAMTTTLLLIGGSLGPISDEVDIKMITRLWQVGTALAYLLAAFVVIDRFLPDRADVFDDHTQQGITNDEER